ncbi:DNA polymerase III subunit beta [Syntrophorhabdus aromaticivorans]|uniref:DNA polymerase III subunit beta n=1 Tax=Syntrophorhabdus aromaticivorans TaxID=328301 RepID=UPI00040EC741|nr:DNA polymerase III subunit beta [Syntrophorhabdus aromaticivorans]
MNISIDKSSILGPISKLVGITEKRSLMPILSNILIEFGTTHTTIYSTDLELSAIGYIEYSTPENKKIVVHGKKFLEILREMDNDEIMLQIDENLLTIKQKQTKIVLSLQDPDEFPEVKKINVDEEFVVDGTALLEMIDKVSFAVSLDETRYILTGMHMRGKDGSITVVGTDGYRMALYEKVLDGVGNFKGITIPKRSLSEIERVIDEGEKVTLSIDEKHVQISTKNIVVVSRVIEGSFPDFENVIPAGNDNVIHFEKELFFKGLKKVSSIIGRSEPVKITLSQGKMEIEAESDIGRAKEVMLVDYGGEEISMNFNVRFVMDVISHINGGAVIMSAPSTYGAVLFREEEGDSYKNIVMPIRV